MCLIKSENMTLPQSIAHKLQCIMQRLSLFYNKQHLRDLNKDEFEHYMNVRSACVQYVKVPHIYFGTQPDTFATALNILDAFLWKVKVTEKHMSIVSIACFFIAAKMMEADEVCPDARDLASLHTWTPKDLCRMELNILGKLGWSITLASYLDFLPLFADIYGVNSNLVLSEAVIKLGERCMQKNSTVLTRAPVLALSLLHHVNSRLSAHPAELQVMVYCNIQDAELKECQKKLSLFSSSNYVSPPTSPKRLMFHFPLKIFDKPSEIGTTCLPTILEEQTV